MGHSQSNQQVTLKALPGLSWRHIERINALQMSFEDRFVFLRRAEVRLAEEYGRGSAFWVNKQAHLKQVSK